MHTPSLPRRVALRELRCEEDVGPRTRAPQIVVMVYGSLPLSPKRFLPSVQVGDEDPRGLYNIIGPIKIQEHENSNLGD